MGQLVRRKVPAQSPVRNQEPNVKPLSSYAIHRYKIMRKEQTEAIGKRNAALQLNGGLKKVKITISGTPNGKEYIANTYPSRDGKKYKVPVYTMTLSGTNDANVKVTKTYDVLRFMPYLNRKADKTGYSTIAEKTIMSGLADARNSPIKSYQSKYQVHNTYTPEDGGFVIYGSFMIHDGPDQLKSNPGWGSAGCIEVTGNNGFSDLKNEIHALSGSDKSQKEGLSNLVSAGKLVLVLEQAKRPNPQVV